MEASLLDDRLMISSGVILCYTIEEKLVFITHELEMPINQSYLHCRDFLPSHFLSASAISNQVESMAGADELRGHTRLCHSCSLALGGGGAWTLQQVEVWHPLENIPSLGLWSLLSLLRFP